MIGHALKKGRGARGEGQGQIRLPRYSKLVPRNFFRSRLPAALLGASLAASAGAFTLEEFTFDDPARTAEFRTLTEELRCLVCQNESLAGSQADLAQDLRKQVYRLMQEGKSKDEVIEFLVARYGDFVLYDPPLKPSTYPLWFGPLLLAAVGGAFLLRTLRRKREGPEGELSAEERRRLQALLAEAPSPAPPPPAATGQGPAIPAAGGGTRRTGPDLYRKDRT